MAAMLLPSVLFPAPSHAGQSTTTPHTEAVAPVARPAWVLAAYVSLWLATVCNYPLWRALAQLPGSQGLRPFAFAVAFAVAIAATLVALTSVFAWRHTLKPMLSLLLLAAAAGAYFMLSYGIVIDSTMLVNALQTDVHETQDLLNWRLPATVLALAGPPLVWLWRQPVLYRQVGRQLLHNTITLAMSLLVAAGALLLFFQDFSSTMRNHTEMRYLINPLNSIYALGNIAAKPLRRDTSKILPMGEDVKLGASYAQQQRPPLLVLVVGETGRSGNFGINGYSRNTTPELGARKDISTALNAWSCGTNTAASVPCMFSHLDKAAFESRKAEYENLPDMLQRAGLAVLWVDNQAGCKGVCACAQLQLHHRRGGQGRRLRGRMPGHRHAARPGRTYRRPARRATRTRRGGGVAPDGKPRPGLCQTLSPGTETLHARVHQQCVAGMQPRPARQRLRQQHCGDRPLPEFGDPMA